MCPTVQFHGEELDKDWLNHYLSTPEGQRKLKEVEEFEAKEKAQEQERKKQLQKQKRAASKSKEEKAAEYFQKYRQELGGPDVVISEESARILWQRARNMVEYELQHEEEEKQHQEWLQEQEQKEKQRIQAKEQERKRKQEALK